MGTQLPIVTVGIPCYNRPEGLKRTLDAITGQSYPHLEIVVSDNCSPDPGIAAVAEAIASEDSRVRYIRQDKNIGPLPNFLFLAECATGTYFMWAADDDWWAPDYIAELVALLEDDLNASLAFSRFAPIEDDFSRGKRYPDFYRANQVFTENDLETRLAHFIRQKDAYGKAHLIYGVIRREVLLRAIKRTVESIERRIEVTELAQFDMLLNAAILSEGHLALSGRLLRRFGSGPRQGARRSPRTIGERLLRYDGRTLVYYNCYGPLIDALALDASQKRSLRRTVRSSKIRFLFERLGRRLLVYKIYWHFVKRFRFHSIDHLTRG